MRFGLLNLFLLTFTIGVIVGGGWLWLCVLAAMFGSSLFDEILGNRSPPGTRAFRWIYDANLYAAVLLIGFLTVVYLHHLTRLDPFGFVQVVSLAGLRFDRAASHSNWEPTIAVGIGVAYVYAMAGMTVAHELSHRTGAAAGIACRTLLALVFNTGFAIAHVHGHHRNVATFRDPGSARRGEYVLAFAVRCSVMQQVEAVRIEAERLRRKGRRPMSWSNRALRDHFWSVALVGASWLVAGYQGAIGFSAAAIGGLLLQKFGDYAQHYGLVRVEGAPVEERHAWDCYRFLSNALQFNLPLHSSHHRAARKPFWELEPSGGAPRLPCGYQTASWAAFIPPLWRRLVDPRLAEWDERMASPEEQALIRQRGWEIPAGRKRENSRGQRSSSAFTSESQGTAK